MNNSIQLMIEEYIRQVKLLYSDTLTVDEKNNINVELKILEKYIDKQLQN